MTADTRRRTRLQWAAVLVLAVGLGVSGFLFWRAGQADLAGGDEAALREQEQSRAYELEMQKNVGPVGLLMSRWSEWLGSPPGVAVEVALAAALASGACFFLATHPPPRGE